ncbi:MAG: LptF/LptG family permease, partial [Candidatus Nitrotoga sp.]
MEWRSALNLGMLRAILMEPGQMSVLNLYQYIQHLRDNHQKTVSYEIAMWNKVVYPFAILV